jgi:hypothetical protein
VVKGRAYHPASQGSVERGNATFKEALDKWLNDDDNRKEDGKKPSWSQVGIYVINSKINNRPSRSKDNKSPYEVYYGKKSYTAPSYILENSLLSQATSEYAVLVTLQLMDDIAKINSSMQIDVNMLGRIMKEADDIYDFAETLTRADEDSYDVDEELQKVVDKSLREIFDEDTIVAAQSRAEAQGTPEKKSSRSRDTKTTNDSPGRKRVREGVKEAKLKQANRVNELCARKSSGKIKSP